jgi:hypothetical protein
MALTIQARGSGTLTKSAPGVQASVEVTVSGVTSAMNVAVQPTTELPVDGSGMHTIIGYTATDKVVVKSSRNELPKDITFDYIVFTGS